MKVKKILSISLLQLVVFINSSKSEADAENSNVSSTETYSRTILISPALNNRSDEQTSTSHISRQKTILKEMVEGCVYSTMTLSCNERKVINISSVVLGDSPGCSNENCCPRHDHCTAKASDNHVNEVHKRCNGRLTCTVAVIRDEIPCERTFLYGYHYNDFERITYHCIDNGRSTTDALKTTLSTGFHADKTKETSDDRSTIEDSTDEPEYTTVTETWTSEEAAMTSGTEPTTIIIAIVCLLVLIIIIVIVIVIVRRKKPSSKIKYEVEMTDAINAQNGIYANQNQDTNGNPNSSSSHQNDGQKCEDPNNAVEYSVVSQKTSPSAGGGAGVEYSSIDIIKSDHKAPATKSEDDGYSLAGDPDDARQSTCVENVYEDVESKPSDSKTKSANIRGGAYEEPIKVGGQAASSGQSNLQQKHPPHSKSDKSVSNNSKVDEGIYKNIGEVGSPLSSPSSPYEPMTPISGQNVYANESAVPFRTESLTSSLGSGSEAHTPYCEMRSPSVKLKDDGAHMLVDNDLYSQ